MRLIVLFNPKAGAGRAAATAERLGAPLAAAGHDPTLLPTRLEDPAEWLDPALAGAEAVVVVGGDGAVRIAAGSAARTRTPLYHYPSGTENLFARQFGMQATPDALLGALARAVVQPVDLGIANAWTFVLMVSVGFDAEVIHDLAARRGAGISHLSYVGPLLRQLAAWDPPRLTVRVDGTSIAEGVPGLVVVANSRQYAMRLDPARDASMTDGALDVVLYPARSRRALVSWAIRTVRGRHLAHPAIVRGRGRTVEVRCGEARRLQLDGDPPGAPVAVSGPAAVPDADGRVRELRISLSDMSLPVLIP